VDVGTFQADQAPVESVQAVDALAVHRKREKE
jgi:hypothetical protein